MNKFICLDDIFNYLDNIVFKSESKTFKLEFKLSGIFETQIEKIRLCGDNVLKYYVMIMNIINLLIINKIRSLIFLLLFN